MKGGARRKTMSSDLPLLSHHVQNEIDDQVNVQVQFGNRNRQQEQQLQRPMNDGENGGNEYDEEQNEDYEEDNDQSGDIDVHGERADGGEDNGDEKRPKLAEGFYVIEAVRKKRIRKGVKQYLIKWCGWPESANTWEPVESFTSCPEVIEAFEESLRYGNNKSNRKRKRKHAVGPTPQSKKIQIKHSPDAAYPVPNVKLKIIEEPCVGPCVHNSNISYPKTTSSTNQDNMTDFAIHIEEDLAAEVIKPANGFSNVDKTEVVRVSPRFGARRRKSCAVKRFKKESNSFLKKDEKTTAPSDVIVQDDINNGLDSENVVDTPQSVSVITKIVKPVNYSTTLLNDTEEVCVSFLVKRSDGEEVVVDNKYLKENNPILVNLSPCSHLQNKNVYCIKM